MYSVYIGNNREKVRAAVQELIEKKYTGIETVRLTDVHEVGDVQSVLQGRGMFARERAVIFEGVLQNEELAPLLLESLEFLKESNEQFFILEEKVDAATKKKLEKYAEKIEKFDAEKKSEQTTAFAMANALQRKDKKALWVSYMRELAKDQAPEMLHGILFWAAKMQVMSARNEEERKKALGIVSQLAELPHVYRRRGVEFEYALEQFVLSVA